MPLSVLLEVVDLIGGDNNNRPSGCAEFLPAALRISFTELISSDVEVSSGNKHQRDDNKMFKEVWYNERV